MTLIVCGSGNWSGLANTLGDIAVSIMIFIAIFKYFFVSFLNIVIVTLRSS